VLDAALSTAAILSAARARRYLAFADVAFGSGAEWRRVRRQMGAHLKGVCADSLARGGPMISAIVVNRRHVATGAMEPETLAGFVASARELGFAVEDGEAFLREQQARTFRFAAAPFPSASPDPTLPP
jgi:5-methylcytosine-specific restriction protein B